MIELYRTKDCSNCKEIEDAFKEMVIAHNVIIVSDMNKINLAGNINLPAIKDDDKFMSGEQEIKKYLEELRKFLSEWNKFQSDSCYIDKDGSPANSPFCDFQHNKFFLRNF